MLKFLKELFFGKQEIKEEATIEAPYKVETPTDNGSHPSWHTAPDPETKPVEVKDVLDVNGDGKVNFDDVKAAVKKPRKPRKPPTPKAESKPVAKPRGRPSTKTTEKTAAKKAPAKKPGRKPAAIKAASKKV